MAFLFGGQNLVGVVKGSVDRVASHEQEGVMRILEQELLGTVNIPATDESFLVAERFVVDTSAGARVKISCVGDKFLLWFGKMLVGPHAGSTLSYSTLMRDAFDGEIFESFGGEEMCEITFAEIWPLMMLRKKNGSGFLCANGNANRFYVRDQSSVLRVILFQWRCHPDGWDGWHVYARELHIDDHSYDERVFVCSSWVDRLLVV